MRKKIKTQFSIRKYTISLLKLQKKRKKKIETKERKEKQEEKRKEEEKKKEKKRSGGKGNISSCSERGPRGKEMEFCQG